MTAMEVQQVDATDDMLVSAPRQPCDAVSRANCRGYSAMLDGRAAGALRSEMTDLKDADRVLRAKK